MTDKTDEEARALLTFPADTMIDFRYIKGQSATSDLWTIESLQKHARFWLMRREIVNVLDRVEEIEDFGSNEEPFNEPYLQPLLDKIKELDG